MSSFIPFGRYSMTSLLAGSLILSLISCAAAVEAPSCSWKVHFPAEPLNPRDFINGTLMLYIQKSEKPLDVRVTFKSPQIGNVMGLELNGEHHITKQNGVNVELGNVRVIKTATLKDNFIDKIEFIIPGVTVIDLSDNRLDIKHQFLVVDPIDVSNEQTYWLTTTVSISKFYKWTGKEAVKFNDKNTNRPSLVLNPIGEFHRFKMQGHLHVYFIQVWHNIKSKATAQNVILEVFHPPHLTFKRFDWARGSVPGTARYVPAARKLRIHVPILHITLELKGWMLTYLDPQKTVPLIWNGGGYMLVFVQSISYHGRTGYVIDNNHRYLGSLTTRRREEKSSFRVKNVPTRQCLSYNNADAKFILSNDCQGQVFHYTESGGLAREKNPDRCFTCFEEFSNLRPCEERHKSQTMSLTKSGAFMKDLYISVTAFLSFGDQKEVKCSSSSKLGSTFYILPELTKGDLLPQPSKSFLQASLGQPFLFCSRHNHRWENLQLNFTDHISSDGCTKNVLSSAISCRESRRKCYFTRNEGKSWIGLHPLVSSLYGYDKSTNKMYFIDHFGRGYLVAKLGEEEKISFYEEAKISIQRAKESRNFVPAVVQDDDLPDSTDKLFQTNLRASRRGLYCQQELTLGGASSSRPVVDYGF